MKEKEIKERNKQIALMLDLNHDEEAVVFNMHSYSWDMLIFHKDWNWLMEAVDFIENDLKESYNVDIVNKNQCEIVKNGEEYISGYGFDTINNTKKEAVFIAVSNFARIYNENKL
jgi:hypothetical protein